MISKRYTRISRVAVSNDAALLYFIELAFYLMSFIQLKA